MITYYYRRTSGQNGNTAYKRQAFSNPLANALVVIVGVLAIAAFVVIGFFAFIIVAALALVLATGIAIRLWWFNRQARRSMKNAPGSTGTEGSQELGVIEGEFVDVSERPQGRGD